MNKAVDFVHAKVDEFGWKVFGEGNVPDETKLLEKRDREKTIITKEFTSNPFQDDGKLKPNIKYLLPASKCWSHWRKQSAFRNQTVLATWFQ